MNHQYYDVHEAAHELGMPANKVRYEALKGRLKHARVNGRGLHRRFIFKRKWLQAFLRRNGRPSTALEANTLSQGIESSGNPAPVLQSGRGS